MRQWVPVFLRDVVKTSEIDAELQGAILLDEEDLSSAWGMGWAYEAIG